MTASGSTGSRARLASRRPAGSKNSTSPAAVSPAATTRPSPTSSSRYSGAASAAPADPADPHGPGAGVGAGGFGGFNDFGGFHGRGQDHFARVEITLEEAYQGGRHPVTLQSPSVDPHGGVQGQQRTLNVRIPAGVTEGQQIRLTGQGGQGVGEGGSGDLYLEVHIKAHPLFRHEGCDVYLDLPLAPWEAALGTQVSVPTLGGEVETKIPAGARSGQRLRLKGRGLPGVSPGDQYLQLQIVAPKPRTEAQRRLYEQMRDQMDFDPRSHLRRKAV